MKQKKLQTHRQKKQLQKNKPFCLFQAFERRIRKLVRRFLLGVGYCRASTARAVANGPRDQLSVKFSYIIRFSSYRLQTFQHIGWLKNVLHSKLAERFRILLKIAGIARDEDVALGMDM